VLAQATPDPQRLEQLIRRREASQCRDSASCYWPPSAPDSRKPNRLPCCWRHAPARRRSRAPWPWRSQNWTLMPATLTSTLCATPDATSTFDARVHHGHLLDATPATLRRRVTLLVAVPPYMPLAAAALLPREAREHEPAQPHLRHAQAVHRPRTTRFMDHQQCVVAVVGAAALCRHQSGCQSATLAVRVRRLVVVTALSRPRANP
jgi:hypothetical protein